MINYENILAALKEEKNECHYAYGEMAPAFYTQALIQAIETIRECQRCEAEARQMAENIRHM